MKQTRICFIAVVFALFCSAFSGFGQTTTITSGSLSVDITISNPCTGSSNGFIQFKVTSSTGQAKLQVVGPTLASSLFIQTNFPLSGIYIHNPSQTLPIGTYNYLIIDDVDVVSTTGFAGPSPPLVLTNAPIPMDFAIVTSTPVVCSGDNIIVTLGPPSELGISYQLRVNGSGVLAPQIGDGASIITFTLPTASYVSGQSIDVVGTLGVCPKVSSNSLAVVENALPIVNAPSPSLCIGGTMALSPAVGGNWVSNDVTKATVTGAGVVTGVSSGNVTFTFTNSSTGCSNTTSSVAINALPVVNAPSPSLCIGGTMALSPAVGGNWVSNDVTKATVTGAGVVTGVSSGNVTFTFTNSSTGCSNTTSSVAINALPVVNAPSPSLCIGGTMALSPAVGGNWVSNDVTKATVTGAGVVTGVSSGNVTFTFTNSSTGCSNTTSSVAINALPVVNAPSPSLCIGGTMALSPAVGGNWVSNDVTKATVTGAGVVTGVSSGNVTFTFTNSSTGCSNTTSSVAINALPVVNAPSPSLCIGGTMALSPAVGGNWVSNDVTKATVTGAGVVTGVSSGNVTFTFTNSSTGCSNTTSSVAINALPVVNAPSPSLCIGGTMALSPAVGGNWVSNDVTKATVTGAGVVTGVSSGNVTFTFTNSSTGCSNTTSSVAINALPVVNAPSPSLCIGGTMALSPAVGGNWVSNDVTKATVTGVGVVTGVSSGNVTFTFTNSSTGCSNTTSSVAINALPVVNAPSPSLCIGGTMALSPAVGGNWVSNDVTKATVTGAGVVTGVSSGNVTFTFTNSSTGCSNTTSSVAINALPVVNAPSPSLCIGGTMALSPAVGGNWVSNDVTKATVTGAGVVTGVSSGNVTFTFTNSSTGCSNTTSSVAINALPVVNAPSPSLCIGGTMNLTPNSGGTWLSSDATKATVTNTGLVTGIGAGSATFTFTDGTGCSASTSSVSINAIPGYNALVTDVTTCTPGNDGSIAVTALGGSGAGYSYSKDNGVSFPGVGATFTFTALTAGSYSIIVKDGVGCVSAATSVTVNSSASGLTFSFTQQNVLCNGGNSGSITVTPSGGSGSYTYSNDNGITFPGSGASFTFISLGAATYPVVVKDTGTGCQFSSSVIITQPALVSFTNAKTDATCNGLSDGTITVTASGGNSVYTYSNDNGATFQASNVFVGLPAATYQVIVRDGNNCLSATSGITIAQPTIVTFTNGSTNPTTCSPGNDGTITITAAGGNGTYQYSNDNGVTFQASNAFTGLMAGSYQLMVKDVNNCLSAVSTVSLTAPGGVTFTSVKQDVTCNGGTDGSITLTTSGGNGSYTYSNDNGATFGGSGSPFTFNSLAAGTYQIVAKDGNGCQFSSAVTINEPLLVTFTSVNVNVLCNGNANGSITITASGGNSTYQYSKDNGVTFQPGSSFSLLVAGLYQVVVKDGNNCISVTTPITITEPPFLSAVFSGLAGPYCTSSGVVNLTPTTPGGTFTGAGISGSTFSPALAGVGTHIIQYLVTSGVCTNSTTQSVTVISSVVDGSFVGLNSTYCNSSIVVTLTPATPGGTFSGSGISGNTFNPSTAGSGIHSIQYSVISGGCTSTTSQSVNVLLSTDPICTGGGGTGTCATVVIVPKPSPATCTSSDGKIVFSIKPFVPIINTTGVRIDIQGVSSTNLGVSRTNFNDSTFLNLPLGTYDFTIEYGEATCIKTGLVTVGQSGTVGSPIATNITPPLCFGEATGSLTLDVPGETGNLLEWSLDANSWTPFTAGSIITGIPAGVAPLFDRVISVRRNSSDLCNAAIIIILQAINPAITATISPAPATCSNNDGTLALSGIGGGSGVANFTYKLNGIDVTLPADMIIKGLSTGTYVFSIVDNIGCQKDLVPVVIDFPGFVNYTTPVVSVPNCTGGGTNGSIAFQITDVGSFLVGYTLNSVAEPTNYFDPAGAPVLISSLSNGNYFIWIKSSGVQCVTKLSPVSVNGTFAISFTPTSTNILCFGSSGEISLDAIKGAPNLDFNFELVKSGVISSGTITAAQSLGQFIIPGLVQGSYQIRLTQNQSTIVPACTLPIASVYQDITIIGPVRALDTLDVKKSISVPDLPTGSMLVGILESEQEPYEVMLELINPLFPGQEFVMDWTVAVFNTNNLKMELSIRNLFAGDYKLSLRDGLGCVKEYDVMLDVDKNIAVPNIFTPNNDGFNDVFFIRNLPADAKLIITNRWGKEVFSSGNYQNDWGGGDISDGVYFYRLSMPSGSITGWVEILRGK